MRRLLGVHTVIVTAALVLTAASVRSQEAKPPAGAAGQPPDEQQMMANAQPGEPHRQLAKLAGEWTYTSKLTVPGQEPQESKGTAKMTMALDGRFLHEQNTGEMMGVPVTGSRVTGFNNATKKYESVWNWTMSTGFLILSGTSPDNGKTINLAGGYDEADGHHKMTVAMKVLSDDHIVFEMGSPEAPGGAVMVLDYTRKGK